MYLKLNIICEWLSSMIQRGKQDNAFENLKKDNTSTPLVHPLSNKFQIYTSAQ